MNEKRFVVWRVKDITNRCYTREEAEKVAAKIVESGEYPTTYVLEVLKVAKRATPPVVVEDF